MELLAEKALWHLQCLAELPGHACHPSVLWQGDVHLTSLSFEASVLSERLQPFAVAKYFPAVFGTEVTSSLCLGRVQGTKTRAAPCCRQACCLAVSWGEGQRQALSGQAGCSLASTSPPLMAFSPSFQVALQSVFRRCVCLEQRAVHKNQWVPKQLLGLGW